MPTPDIIAIDGPAASGKSTLGHHLAEALGYLFLDTGIMYRAVTWAALHQKIDVYDEAAVTALARQIHIDVRPPLAKTESEPLILVDGKNINREIVGQEVEARVSVVSAYPGVRQAMTEHQRRIARRGRVVMVGRDIGTVVLPDAQLKIYLVASEEERARRRYKEKQMRGEKVSYEEILAGLRQRDQIDSTRAVAPLKPAEDAKILDSEGLDIEAVVEKAKEFLK